MNIKPTPIDIQIGQQVRYLGVTGSYPATVVGVKPLLDAAGWPYVTLRVTIAGQALVMEGVPHTPADPKNPARYYELEANIL